VSGHVDDYLAKSADFGGADFEFFFLIGDTAVSGLCVYV
jgi:hypothetical protein